jgi:hypothetical protein
MAAEDIQPGTEIAELHCEIFGDVPKKDGTAYERLAAVVLAGLGWIDVEHDRVKRPPGRQADHRLDVVCRRPDGEVERLVVECKDWAGTVGQEVLDRLVGVRNQVGADATAVVTRQGFTAGARRVAADEDIAMVILRPYDPPRDDGTWVRRVDITLKYAFRIVEDVHLLSDTASDEQLSKVRTEEWMSTYYLDGSPAETFRELWMRGTLRQRPDGSADGSIDLPEGRLVETWGDERLSITGATWTERGAPVEQRIVSQAEGTPVLVLQQLDEHGEPDGGQVIVDTKLKVWDIAGDGTVTRRH